MANHRHPDVERVRDDPEVRSLIAAADAHLAAEGFTEHGPRHVTLVSHIAHNVLAKLGHDHRHAELAAIAGLLHDIGNVASRHDHGQTGSVLAWGILRRFGMEADEAAVILGAIGNHEEETGQPVNDVAAALILADKSDVHRSRVRNRDAAKFDIHDRVNYAVEHSFLRADAESRRVALELKVDTSISPVMEYFEIWLSG